MLRTRKQNSTGRPVTFLLVSSSDHVTPQTGKTATVTLSKDGGAFGAAAGAVSEIGNGVYALAGNATDRNTLGELILRATATGCDDALVAINVIPADPYDANLGLTNLDQSVSSRSTYAGGDTAGTTTLLGRLTSTRAGNLDNLDTNVGSRAAPGAAMTLTSGERSAVAGAVDMTLINTADGADLLTAIADKIAQDWIAGDASPLAIVSALTANATFIQLVSDAAAAKTAAQALPNAAAVRAEMDSNSTKLARLDENVSAAKTLTAAYDRAKNAASNTELTTAQNAITTAVGSPMQAGSYTAPPSADAIAAAVLTKKVEDVIAGLGDTDDHTLAFVIELFTEAARVAGAIRVRKPDGTTWKDKTVTENANQVPVASIT